MTKETAAEPQGACTTKQRHNKHGKKETNVSCPFSEATYTDGKLPTLVLSSYGANSAGGIDEKGKTELIFDSNAFRVFSKTVSGNETVRLSAHSRQLNYNSVYCEPSWASTGALVIDRFWEKTQNAGKQPTKSILADQAQHYAKQHPQVVEEILKVKPVIGVSSSGNFTLEEALAMKSPQFVACPSDPQSKKEGIVIQKHVRD